MYFFSKQVKSQSSLPKLKGAGRVKASPSTANLVSHKKVFKTLPSINEPVFLRYDPKAQFEAECDNLTYATYNKYEPSGTNNDWTTIQVFNRKKPRDYLKQSIRRGIDETFGEDVRASRSKLLVHKQ